jgi:hypothetical protein
MWCGTPNISSTERHGRNTLVAEIMITILKLGVTVVNTVKDSRLRFMMQVRTSMTLSHDDDVVVAAQRASVLLFFFFFFFCGLQLYAQNYSKI